MVSLDSGTLQLERDRLSYAIEIWICCEGCNLETGDEVVKHIWSILSDRIFTLDPASSSSLQSPDLTQDFSLIFSITSISRLTCTGKITYSIIAPAITITFMNSRNVFVNIFNRRREQHFQISQHIMDIVVLEILSQEHAFIFIDTHEAVAENPSSNTIYVMCL